MSGCVSAQNSVDGADVFVTIRRLDRDENFNESSKIAHTSISHCAIFNLFILSSPRMLDRGVCSQKLTIHRNHIHIPAIECK